jgi:ribosomal protein S13
MRLVRDADDKPVKVDGGFKVLVELTDEDYEAMGKELSKHILEKLDVQREKKEVDARYNEQIKGLDEVIEVMSTVLESGEKEEVIPLTVKKNHIDNVLMYYNDTDECIGVVPMDPKDKQEDIFSPSYDEPLFDVDEKGRARKRNVS